MIEWGSMVYENKNFRKTNKLVEILLNNFDISLEFAPKNDSFCKPVIDSK
jgi:hypothetical protein